MTNSDDTYNKKFKDLTDPQRQELIDTYRKLGEYYTKINHSTSKTIFNWGFALNTGGLAAAITFMQNLPNHALSFLTVIFIFTLGIISIVLAMFLEHARFKIKGNHLEKKFRELDDSKITQSEFIDSVFPTTPDCCESIVQLIEKSSYIIFFIGLLVSLILLFNTTP